MAPIASRKATGAWTGGIEHLSMEDDLNRRHSPCYKHEPEHFHEGVEIANNVGGKVWTDSEGKTKEDWKCDEKMVLKQDDPVDLKEDYDDLSDLDGWKRTENDPRLQLQSLPVPHPEQFLTTYAAKEALTVLHRSLIVRNHLTSQNGGLALVIRKLTGVSITLETDHVRFAGLAENVQLAQEALLRLLSGKDRWRTFEVFKSVALQVCKATGERDNYKIIKALQFQN
ncbi:hypothetical protein F5X68DRAFT_240774 [Plectosphaerella plurivora]|uniref:Uncharacterized protein n=1 Tax=Plectosphaerella plurivora TaxID=936078 RepID=A0A9P8VB26_9PEZI|nr:hypothetical protein F5X68DRAFT_240774 [Plectosphaerella plurivora]